MDNIDTFPIITSHYMQIYAKGVTCMKPFRINIFSILIIVFITVPIVPLTVAADGGNLAAPTGTGHKTHIKELVKIQDEKTFEIPIKSDEGATTAPAVTSPIPIFTTLNTEFSFGSASTSGYKLPHGSTIKYFDGYTEVYNPDDVRIGNVSDSNAKEWFIPGRHTTTPAVCTHSIEVPNNSYIFHEAGGVDYISMNPDGSDRLATIHYDMKPPTARDAFIPENRSPQWVVDFNKPVPKTIQKFDVRWSVAKNPTWDFAAGQEDAARGWQFAIFNGIETTGAPTPGKWFGIIQPVLHWNAIENPESTTRGALGALPPEALHHTDADATGHKRWAISSHSVGNPEGASTGVVDMHTKLKYEGVDKSSIRGRVERDVHPGGWDVETSSLIGGALVKLHTADPTVENPNNLETVVTLERHRPFNPSFQIPVTRWPGNITFTDIAITGGGGEQWMRSISPIEVGSGGADKNLNPTCRAILSENADTALSTATTIRVLTPNQ